MLSWDGSKRENATDTSICRSFHGLHLHRIIFDNGFSYKWPLMHWYIYRWFIKHATVADEYSKRFAQTYISAHRRWIQRILRQVHRVHRVTLQWRHNEYNGVSNHRRLYYLFRRMFMRRSKKTSKLLVTGLCEGSTGDRLIPLTNGQ